MSGDKTKPARAARKPSEWTEELRRGAARESIDESQDEMEEELEEGLDDTFPASDPPTATRPGAEKEDRKEKPKR